MGKTKVQLNPEKVKTFKYRRSGIKNPDTGTWETFYINKKGAVKFDQKNLSYNEIKFEIKKNKVPDLKTDIYNTKESKQRYSPLIARHKNEKFVDTVIKKVEKKIPVDETALKLAEKYAAEQNYQNEEITMVYRQLRKKRKKISGTSLSKHVSHVSLYNGTSAHFHFSKMNAKSIIGMGNKLKDQFDKFHVEFKTNKKIFQGTLEMSAFENKKSLDDAMSKILEKGGKVDHYFDDINIVFKGIKK